MTSSEGDNLQIRYYFNGLEVYSPYKLYASQKMMITKTLTGLQSCRHCLLESPTGSGKTLAMLCAALAWQENEYKLQNMELIEARKAEELKNNSKRKGNVAHGSSLPPNCVVTPDVAKTEVQEDRKNQYDDSFLSLGSLSDDDDFKPFQRIKRKSVSSPLVSSPKRTNTGNFQDIPANVSETIPEVFPCTPKKNVAEDASLSSAETDTSCKNNIRRVPKIFYGTRTHKQITQIIRELKKTAYKNVQMTILGSRNNTCIHPQVSRSANKNELCLELMPKKYQKSEDVANKVCTYYIHSQKIKNSIHKYSEIESPWDIENLLKYGKNNRVCPYYFSRDLLDGVDIVFCPYQYLIDPMIRKSMCISLTNQVVILDEAHNIEDVSRESASFSITEDDMHIILSDLEKYETFYKFKPEIQSAYNRLACAFSKLNIWLLKKSKSITSDDGLILSGVEMASALQELELGPDKFGPLKQSLEAIASENENAESEVSGDKISNKTLNDMEHLFLVIEYMYGRNLANVEDYKICLKKEQKQYLETQESGQGKNSRRSTFQLVTSLSFWCLNPAIVFGNLGTTLRSIVVTSGTLSPIDSFESELGVKFSVKIEAPHVIGPSQVLAYTIGKGPNSYNLNGSFQSTSALRYQDELGQTVLNICQAVPHGVLCFFPSYSLMNKLSERWQATGLWTSIEKCKIIVIEPRQITNHIFEFAMDMFFEGVKGNRDNSECTGALLLAVYRGKISEGIDFADDYARAVIAIGIPFPNLRDQQIKMKREYNNKFSASRGLLSGNRWYEIQAFRALNQALGRCVRHSADWGALFLIDDRLNNESKYTDNISKWVRQYLRKSFDFSFVMETLQQFIQNHKTKSPSELSITEALSMPQLDQALSMSSQSSNDNVVLNKLMESEYLSPSLAESYTCKTTADKVIMISDTPIKSNKGKLRSIIKPKGIIYIDSDDD